MRPRRRFLKALAAAPLAPSALLAAQAPSAPPPTAPAAPPPAPGAEPPGPAARALGQVVRHRYGAQLEAADLELVDKAIESNLQAAERLKNAVRLGNADEPATLFEARPPAPRAGARG
jgi:hypothetical protein